jgi:hypothetical protein
MFNPFRRRRISAPADAAAPDRPTPAAPSDNADSWQIWEGAAADAKGAGHPPASTSAAAASAPPNLPPNPPSGGRPPDPPSSEPPGPPPGPPPAAPPRGLALDEIARGMQHAAASANQLLAHQYIRVLDTFFDTDKDGRLTARSVEVELDAEHTMPVPLVALATPRGLGLEKMIVHLTVRGDFAEALPVDGGDHRAHFHVTLAPPSKRASEGAASPRERDTEHIDIEMHFTALEPPDAIMRVIDEYTHRLVPRPKPGSPRDPGAAQANEKENPHA